MTVLMILLLQSAPVVYGEALVRQFHTYDIERCFLRVKPHRTGATVRCELTVRANRPGARRRGDSTPAGASQAGSGRARDVRHLL